MLYYHITTILTLVCLRVQNDRTKTRVVILSFGSKFSIGSLCLQMNFLLFVSSTFCSLYQYTVPTYSYGVIVLRGVFMSRRIFRTVPLVSFGPRFASILFFLCFCSYLAFAGYCGASRRCASRECRNINRYLHNIMRAKRVKRFASSRRRGGGDGDAENERRKRSEDRGRRANALLVIECDGASRLAQSVVNQEIRQLTPTSDLYRS